MAMSWDDLSELTFGRIYDGKLSLNSVTPEYFKEPYREMVSMMKSKPDWSPSDLVAINLTAVQTAQDAVHNINGAGDGVDWVNLLRRAAVQTEVGIYLKRSGEELIRGKEIDVPKLATQSARLVSPSGSMQRLSEVEAIEMPLIKCGYKPVDLHIGGIPESGLLTIVGPPKMGKTTLLVILAVKFALRYPEKYIVLFSIEMRSGQLKQKMLDLFDQETLDKVGDHIIICDDAVTAGEIAARAASVTDLGFVGVDFADMLVQGKVDPAGMEEIYRILALLSKSTHVPVVLLAQLSGGWQGGLPRPFQIRWTRMAEALSWMVWSIYRPDQDSHDVKKDVVPHEPGIGYIAAWLCRSKVEAELPGAIQIRWANGWSLKTKGKWIPIEQKSMRGKKSDDGEVDEDWSKEYQ